MGIINSWAAVGYPDSTIRAKQFVDALGMPLLARDC